MRCNLLIFLCLLFTLKSYSQNNESQYQLISINKVVANFSNEVDLTLPNKRGSYNKTEAEEVLNTFYQNFNFLEYQKKHSGSSAKGNQFEIGHLKSHKTTFRTYVLYRKVDGEHQIIELRIEEE